MPPTEKLVQVPTQTIATALWFTKVILGRIYNLFQSLDKGRKKRKKEEKVKRKKQEKRKVWEK